MTERRDSDDTNRSTLATLGVRGDPLGDLNAADCLSEGIPLDVCGVLCDPASTTWQRDLNERAGRIDNLLLVTGHEAAAVETDGLDSALGRRTSVRTAESPRSLGEVAVRVSDHLARIHNPSAVNVVFVDSLGVGSTQVNKPSIQRFLHALTESVRHNEAVCHVHLDCAGLTNDDCTVLSDLFDVVLD